MGNKASKSSIDFLFRSAGSYFEYEAVIQKVIHGDLIEIHRGYRHWVLYEKTNAFGSVWRYHVTVDGEHNSSWWSTSGSVGSSANYKAMLKYEPLKYILLYNEERTQSLCRVNNKEVMAQEMLKTIGNQKPDLEQVFQYLDQNKGQLFDYRLKSHNCEPYCTLWKYGIGWSSKVNGFREIITTALKMMSSYASTGSQVAIIRGSYAIGVVCLLISNVLSVAVKVLEKIKVTLNDLKVEVGGQAIAK